MRVSHMSLALLLLSALCGCGGGDGLQKFPTVPVKGTVKLKGGAPLTKGLVQFQGGGVTGSGSLNDKGEYTIQIINGQAGLPPGTYDVALLNTAEGSAYPDASSLKPVIDAKYAGTDTSGLQAIVSGKEGTFDFEVEPFAAK